MQKSELAARIRAAAYLTGEFKLRSGQTSAFYWDKYRFESDPALLAAVAEEMQRLLPANVQKLAGLELGGVPIATALSLRCGMPVLFVRKKAKDYGTENLVEGGFTPGERVVVIEDVITTAGQVIESVGEMRKAGLIADTVICAIDRQQGGAEKLREINVELRPVFTLAELG